MSSEGPPLKDGKFKIIIIGAGMAGLSAANLLIQNHELDFIILESRNRIGGRIVSVEADGNRLELGANWIHGVLGNPIYEMAVSNGLVNIVQEPKPLKVVASTEDGKQIPFKIVQEVYEAYSCFLRRCEEYFLCQYLPPAGVESVGEHIELEIALYLERLATSEEEKKVRKMVFDCLLKRESCISGCTSMADIDLLELGSYVELQGGNISLPSGYSSILDPASKNIPQEKILKGKKVAKVYWRSDIGNDEEEEEDDSEKTVTEGGFRGTDQVTKFLPKEETSNSHLENRDSFDLQSVPRIKVISETGEVFLADHLICTLPLGVLKEEGGEIFVPRLPDYKLEAIDHLMFGTVDKIFLIYERPFLNSDISEVMLLWDRESKTLDISETWYKKIYSFSTVNERILLGWISGEEAEYMETLTEQEVSETCTTILRKFLNDPFIPRPKMCIRTHWFNEIHTKGSYTSIGVGASQCDIEAIAQPLYADLAQTKPIVLFGGEHTHPSFYSTVHGAYLTGRACAQALLSRPPEQTLDTIEIEGTSDLSSWLQGISLESNEIH